MKSKFPSDIALTKIEKTINGLLPETAFFGKYDKPATLTDRMARFRIPGVSIAVVNDGLVEWIRGFGIRRWGGDDPVTEDTLFQVASISKPVFALAVMHLWEAGKLDIDEDVNVYLRSWRVPKNGDWQPRVTLRQILTHTAGFTVHGFLGYSMGQRIPSVVEILQGTVPSNSPPVEVNIFPGLQYRYSGGGMTVAQQAITDFIGKPFPEIMRQEVLEPLGMTRSSFEQPPSEHIIATAATGHHTGMQPIAGGSYIHPEMAAAGLWTTPGELALLGIEMQKALQGKSQFLGQKTATEMLTIQGGMGLGFAIAGKGSSARFLHYGGNGGFLSAFIMYQRHGQGAVVMINADQGTRILDEILRSIAIEYCWKDYLPQPTASGQSNPSDLDSYVGAYRTESGVDIVATKDADVLFLAVGKQAPVTLQQAEHDCFFAKAVDARINFVRNENGAVLRLTIDQSGCSTHAIRIIVETARNTV